MAMLGNGLIFFESGLGRYTIFNQIEGKYEKYFCLERIGTGGYMKIKALFLSGLVAVMIVSLSGCFSKTRPQWKSEPDMATVENEQYIVRLIPNFRWAADAFILSIVNKTDKNIEINWGKTLFISGGQTSGGFMFEGVSYRDRNNPNPADIIFGNSTFTKTIYPITLSAWEKGWDWTIHESILEGDYGAYVTLLVDGKEVGERLFLRIFKTEVPR